MFLYVPGRSQVDMYVPRGENWSSTMLGMLSSCNSFAPSAWKIRTLKGVNGDRGGRREDTRQYEHVWKSICEQPSIVAVVVGASWDVGTDKAREWDVVWRSTDKTETLLSANWNEKWLDGIDLACCGHTRVLLGKLGSHRVLGDENGHRREAN